MTGIARTWHGATPIEKSDEYLAFLRSVGISEYKDVAGNQGAFVLRRQDEEVAHFILLSFWSSIDAVKAYAGENISVARYHPNDRNYLLALEESIEHYTVYSD